jgi:hypothetical protein
MPVIVFPGTALTVFEKQNFISRFSITAGSTLTSYTITPSDTVSSSFANHVTVSIDSDQRSSLTISGYYDDIFVNTTVTGVPARGSSVTTWTNWTSIPTDPYPYAITGFDPDPRTRIDMTITINTNNGTTSLVQWVRIDYNYWRNRFLALVHDSQVDARTNNNSYRAPDLPLPANIDSDTLKEAFIFSTSITGTLTYFDLNVAANLAGYDAQRGSVPLYADVNIAAGGIIQATSTATWAFTTGDLPTGVGQHQITINNAGAIRGMGGAGGRASGPSPANGFFNGSPGSAGGTAINLTTNVSINNTGIIAGGGGGGGGGGSGRSVLFGYYTFFNDDAYGGGGGGGPRVGTGGIGYAGNFFNGKIATETAPGAGGGRDSYSNTQGGVGGSGGTFGNTGVAGAAGNGNNIDGAGGAGGAGGKAIALNGKTVTYINTGTINGAVA